MPRVQRLSNSTVYVHARREHPPPHFHVIGPGWEIKIETRAFKVMRGYAPPSDLAEIKQYWATHRQLLLDKWDEYNERDP